jgi:hypothetical protein
MYIYVCVCVCVCVRVCVCARVCVCVYASFFSILCEGKSLFPLKKYTDTSKFPFRALFSYNLGIKSFAWPPLFILISIKEWRNPLKPIDNYMYHLL